MPLFYTHSRTFGSAPQDNSSLKRLINLLRPELARLAAVVLVLIGLAAVNMLFPLCIKLLLDDVFPQENWPLLCATLSGLIVIYIARNLLYFFSKTAAVRSGENVCFNLRNSLFDRLQHMNLQYHKQAGPGELTSRVMHDSFTIQSFIQDDLPKLLLAAFMFLGLVACLYAINWQLALAATIVLPLHLIVFGRFRRPIKDSSRAAQHQLAQVQGNLLEKLLGVEVIKGFTGEQRETEAFSRATDQSRTSHLQSKTYHVKQKIIGDLLVCAGMIALLGFGAYQVMERQMEVGVFIAFFVWVGMLYPTVIELMTGLAKLTRSSASIERVFELLESTQPEQHHGGATDAIEGRLQFEDVCFAYDAATPVLRHVSFQVEPGQVCAIVGPSGAGKSTLVSLVPRFNEPDLGRLLLDGRDIRQIDLTHLRRHIGIAFQECFLFNSSILENIKYASPDATTQQITEVAQCTGAHDFIARLPNGYHTMVGEAGVTLSRGQKQRINLTRAMLKNPKILILDEATASIDTASVAQIIPAILQFMKGKTTLMITHQPELLRHADVITRLEEGRVTYHGDRQHIDLDAPSAPTPPPQPRNVPGALSAVLLAGAFALASLTALTHSPAFAQETAAAATSQSARFVPQPGLSSNEVHELLNIVVTHAASQLHYKRASRQTAAALPDPPQGLRDRVVLARTDDNQTRLLQLNYRTYVSQPVHVWLSGQITTGEGEPAANPDLDAIVKFLDQARESRDAQLAAMKTSDMAVEKVKLSYVDPQRALQMLTLFGYSVVQPGTKVDPNSLPVVVAMPATDKHEFLPDKNATFPQTDADPIHELLVFYHPAQPNQLSQILDKIRTVIDVAARQIVIEAMVLEISEVGLERLGIEWELESPSRNLASLRIGRPAAFATATDEIPTLDVALRDVFGEFSVTIEALIREGHAQIMSRPSVLTLDNRMAYINVVRRIPVVNSVTNASSNTVNTSFSEKIAGITLNVRPRVSADDKEISMQVVAAVTNQVPNQDVIVLNSNGDEVARSPTIAEREVRTYTRIANNTPFIIGGLVSRDEIEDTDKVPLLGDIPLIGPLLFQTNRQSNLKREVIIVITPRLLPETRTANPALPEDKDAFDSFNNKLFRDAYRIRNEDVFDLGFLLNNRQLQRMQHLADLIVHQDEAMASQYPFDRFSRGRIPGERILVYRQMYEVIKRRGIADDIDPARMIFFKPDADSQSGFKVTFLTEHLTQLSDIPARIRKPKPHHVLRGLKGKALAMTYTLQSYDADAAQILAQPAPHVQLIDCPDEQTWSHRLWELNQPDREGKRRYTILLRNEDDMTRLRRAVVLKRTVALNAKRQALTLDNFTIGRLILMPTVKQEKVYLVDDETAKYFFYTEQYYPAVRHELTRDMEAIKNILRDPQFEQMLPLSESRRGVGRVQWQAP